MTQPTDKEILEKVREGAKLGDKAIIALTRTAFYKLTGEVIPPTNISVELAKPLLNAQLDKALSIRGDIDKDGNWINKPDGQFAVRVVDLKSELKVFNEAMRTESQKQTERAFKKQGFARIVGG